MIPEAEKARRRRAVASSEGSLALEGQVLDDFTRALNEKYIAGKITLEEFSAATDKHVSELVQALHRESLAMTA